MKRKTTLAALMSLTVAALLVSILPAQHAAAYPKPAIVSPSWSLEFSFETPSLLPYTNLQGELHWYWYMPYKVVNKTGEDRLFIPEITIADDSGRIIAAGQDVPAGVFDAIKKELGNPLLESPIAVVGKILQGEDFARESVAIWPVSATDVDEITLFFGGLHGETAAVKSATKSDDDPESSVMVRRTAMLRFVTPGSSPNPKDKTIRLLKQTDVMR